MSARLHKWLVDILLAIEEIDSYYYDNHTFNFFVMERIKKKATERNLEIIGEAMSRILKEFPQAEITNAKRIIGLRNIIIHGYDNISDENIWSVVVTHLPILKTEVKTLINDLKTN